MKLLRKLSWFNSKRLLGSLLFCLISACGTDLSDPNQVALTYVEAVYSGSTADFKQVVAERDHDGTEDHKLFVTRQSSGKHATNVRRDGIQSMDVTGQRVGETSATVRIKVIFNNKEQKNLSIRLQFDNDRWYVKPMTWADW